MCSWWSIIARPFKRPIKRSSSRANTSPRRWRIRTFTTCASIMGRGARVSRLGYDQTRGRFLPHAFLFHTRCVNYSIQSQIDTHWYRLWPGALTAFDNCQQLGVVSLTLRELSKIISRKYTMPEITFMVRISRWKHCTVPFGYKCKVSAWNSHKK